MRTGWLIAAVIGCAVFAGGCGDTLLVHDPLPPIFLSRTDTGQLTAQVPQKLPIYGPQDTTIWIPKVSERQWQFIVIHHSATPTGNAAEFDKMHRDKGWDELGYHFVIGNGTGSRDGEVEIGPRWVKQKHGAHCKVTGHPEYNDVGIGICLVGNFDVTHPTEAQMASLARLVKFLMKRYNVPRGSVYGHGQLKPTDCPGRNFDYSDLWRRVGLS
jgi:N-acetyl-anhydromuramyl-L-alanine amidase AmpD